MNSMQFLHHSTHIIFRNANQLVDFVGYQFPYKVRAGYWSRTEKGWFRACLKGPEINGDTNPKGKLASKLINI